MLPRLLILLQIACRTRSEITFDVAMVAPMIANLNAALGHVISEVSAVDINGDHSVTMVTDVSLLLHRFYSGLIYVPHQSIIVMTLHVN